MEPTCQVCPVRFQGRRMIEIENDLDRVKGDKMCEAKKSKGGLGLLVGVLALGAIVGFWVVMITKVMPILMPKMMAWMMPRMMDYMEEAGVEPPCAQIIRSLLESQEQAA